MALLSGSARLDRMTRLNPSLRTVIQEFLTSGVCSCKFVVFSLWDVGANFSHIFLSSIFYDSLRMPVPVLLGTLESGLEVCV